jgi:indole-3-glycerol phosphate synthase
LIDIVQTATNKDEIKTELDRLIDKEAINAKELQNDLYGINEKNLKNLSTLLSQIVKKRPEETDVLA